LISYQLKAGGVEIEIKET